MTDQTQELVKQFLCKLGYRLPERPDLSLMTPEMRRLWARIFLEEALELVRGLGVEVTVGGHKVSVKKLKEGRISFWVEDCGPDMIEIADGAADCHFVLLAICSLVGITEQPLIEEICANNLLKFAPGHRFEDGKLKKPPGHPKPRVAEILAEQGRVCDSGSS